MKNKFLFLIVVCCLAEQAHSGTGNPNTSRHSLPGITEPVRAVDLSVMQDGVVAEVTVEEGTSVKRDQLLIKLKDDVAVSLVKVKEVAANQDAELSSANTELRQAQYDFARAQKIGKLNAASKADVEKAKTQLQLAEANVDRILRDVRQKRLEVMLERARLKAHHVSAPFDGILLRVNCQVGQAAKHGEPIMRLVDLRSLRVVLHLPWEWREEIQVGREVRLEAHQSKFKDISARVASAERVIDPATSTFRCVLIIDNHDFKLPAGFTVSLEENEVVSVER